ncbi:MAG TPA: LysM peptidoglycan-binding domain-containing protein, partial [Ilumatobacteraceae bacterium]|nr:LysM peptidoglycan-binding domain-containing protein [Ilumatobacteraceae bacterium]
VALVVSLAFVVGVPVLLVRYGEWPITSTPTIDQARDLVDTVVSDTMVFGVLTVAAWIVWAGFTASLLVESVAAIRGGQAPHLSFAGPLQRSARVLVAAIVLAVSLSHNHPAALAAGRASSPAPLPQRAVVAAQVTEPTHVPRGFHTPENAGAADAVPNASTPAGAVTVHRGDSAWGLAEQHLGDGMRWRELWELNRDRPQPDGRTWSNPQLIQAGWQILLPTSESPAAEPPVEPAMAEVHTVIDGETLSGIAEARLGDADRYGEIFELNRDVEQPDGRRLTDPNLIVVGWELRIPTPEPASDAAEPTPAASGDATTGDVEADPPIQAPPTTTAPVATTTSNVGSTAATTVPSVPADEQATPPPHPETRTASTEATEPNAISIDVAAADDPDESWLRSTAPVLAGISGATVLATGLLMRLRRSRRRDQLRGAHAVLVHSAAEQAVVAAADVPLVRWAGQALAQMTSRIDRRNVGTRAPLAVELSDEGLEVLWDSPQPDAPAPWLAADQGLAWRLSYDPDADIPADELPAAIPALVTVGDRDGRQLMIDLEAFGTIAVSGPPQRVDDFLRAIALELSTDEDLADTYAVAIGLDGVPTTDRLMLADVETAGTRLTATCESVSKSLASDGAPTTFTYRCGNNAVHLEATVVIVIPSDGDATSLPTVGPRLGAALVIAADVPDAGAFITITDDGAAQLDPLGISFMAAAVPMETASVVERLSTETTVEQDGEPRTNGYHAQPIRVEDIAAPATNGDAPALFELHDDEESDDDTDQPPRSPLDASLIVKVLGTPHVPDRPDLKRRELILTVYLACRGRQVTASSVQDALWNGRAVQGKTVWNLVGRTRTALGTLPDGTWVLTPSDRTRRMKGLSPQV